MSSKRSAFEGGRTLENSADPNRFEIRSLLGEGGMGKVYLAFDHLMLREVALKTLREDLAESAELRHRFVQEAQLTGQLDHPNVLPVYELKTSSEGAAPSVIVKHVDGETYLQLIERLHASPTDAKLYEALQAFLKVCDAMSFAHERRVIHCDLKPDNIMVGKHGQVYVMDWGVAFVQGTEAAPVGDSDAETTRQRSHGLRSSSLGGTLAYMAPEQLTGDRSAIGATTDVYGLGGVLCVLLTGKPPRQDASGVAEWYDAPSLV